jgi:hypothetical protein
MALVQKHGAASAIIEINCHLIAVYQNDAKFDWPDGLSEFGKISKLTRTID